MEKRLQVSYRHGGKEIKEADRKREHRIKAIGKSLLSRIKKNGEGVVDKRKVGPNVERQRGMVRTAGNGYGSWKWGISSWNLPEVKGRSVKEIRLNKELG